MLDNKKEVVLALGFFDSVHLGHQEVIKKAKELALKLNSKTVVATFKGNLKAFLFGEKEKTVYSLDEREVFINQLGVDDIFFAPVNKEFLSLTKKEFLDFLNEKYSVKGYVCGLDYRFGINGEGCAKDIKEYASQNNQVFLTVDTFLIYGKRVSTTLIKEHLKIGDIKGANALLGRSYSITGKVFEDRKIGTALGFPTLNIKINSDKFLLKDGVYLGKVNLDNKEYLALINYGARPTFNLNEKLIEAHLVGYSGNLYGQSVTLNFIDFMRDIVKFNNMEELKNQLSLDLERAKEYD